MRALDKLPYFDYTIIKENGDEEVIPFFRYVNSENRLINLTKPPFIGELSNDLLGFKWTPITQGQAVQKIVKFEKYMVQKKFNVLISGDTPRNYYANLEQFLQITDKDINNLKMGRLYVGDYYLECYIVASGKKKKYLSTGKTLIELSVICERGNWQSEHLFKFSPTGSQGNEGYTGNGIYYEIENGVIKGYDYNYDYAAPFTKNEFANASYMDTDFEITLYGATNTPKVVIGGNTYEFVDLPLLEHERIVINSKDKTCILYRQNGSTENVFKYRGRESKIYEKIKGGANAVIIPDENASVDIKLFYERSEPKWSDELWI